MPKIVGGGYAALSGAASQTDDVMVVVDVHDTTEDASGTTKTITLANLAEALDSDTASDIQPDGTQAAGGGTLLANAQHVHPAAGGWVPSDNGLLAANFPPYAVDGGVTCNAGNLFLMKVPIRQPFTATTLWTVTSVAAVGTSTQSFTGIWNSSGTLLTGSADIGSTFLTPIGVKSVNWTTPQNLTTAMGFVWVGFVFNMGTTQPSLRTAGSNSPLPVNVNLSAAQAACAVNGTAVTALANITPASNNPGPTGNATAFWVGIS